MSYSISRLFQAATAATVAISSLSAFAQTPVIEYKHVIAGSVDSFTPTSGSGSVSLGGSSSEGLSLGGSFSASLGTFNIVINPGAGLAANPAAVAAFNRAANLWEAYISDPVTVTINADLAPLGAGILGSSSSVDLQAAYNTIRNAMVADNTLATKGPLTDALPTAAQFSGFVPAGIGISGNMVASKANLKAQGFAGLDGAFGVSDGDITFSSTFGFDFDNSNGVGAALYDFESVAAHEIGHALGFFSAVDVVDFLVANPGVTPRNIGLNPLDLFRFGNVAGQNPATLAEFTTKTRELRSGVPGYFDQISADVGQPSELALSTGVDTGDGRQASHWKDNALTGNLIGIMDPTFPSATIGNITTADLLALDVIGWDVTYTSRASVPDNGATVSLLLALCGLAGLRLRFSRQS